MELIEGLAVAALALLDPFHEPPQKAFDRLLIHGALRQGHFAVPAGAGLPTCFRSHPVPHDDTRPIGRGTGREDTRRSGGKPRWQARVNFALSSALLWDRCGGEAPRAGAPWPRRLSPCRPHPLG